MNNIIKIAITSIFITSSVAYSADWYDGGTLDSLGALDWQKATPHNKVASASNFVGGLYSNKTLKPSIRNTISTLDDFKPLATELAMCIENTTKKDSNPKINKSMYANQTVTSLATLCMVNLGWVK